MTVVWPAAALAIAAATGLALAAVFADAPRRELLFGLTGLLLALVAAAAPNLFVIALIVLAAVLLQARLRPGGLPARAPALGAGLLGFAGYAAEGGSVDAGRLAALSCALAMVALAGVLPFLPASEPEDRRPAATGLAWSAYLGPAFAVAIFARAGAVLPAIDFRIFGGLLLTFGSLNLVWGLARRLPLLTDWGLALIGLGLLTRDGVAAGYLLLLALLLLRQPVLLWAGGGAGVLTRLALGGSPPFGGFPARILILRAATASYWPFGLAVAVALVVALPVALLTSSEAPRDRRQVVGNAVALALSAAIGIYPALVLRPVGLG